jgi:poly(ADP-ribose) glycohydrolase
MLFVDALELDLDSSESGLPDLLPGKAKRELNKAYRGFQSGSSPGKPFSIVYTGYWGCRSFGGNVAVKSMIQWCAASLAGCNLSFICSNAEQHAFGVELQKFVEAARQTHPDRADLLMQALLNMEPDLNGHSSALSCALDQLVAAKIKDGVT